MELKLVTVCIVQQQFCDFANAHTVLSVCWPRWCVSLLSL